MDSDDRKLKRKATGSGRGLTLGLTVLPVLIAAAITAFNPAFLGQRESGEAPLENPLGGDFLQEYTGGTILNRGPSDSKGIRQLYDLDTFRDVQHDSEVTGFEWKASRYFPPVYPPFWYALMRPLAALPYMAAAVTWLFLMAAALSAALFLLLVHYPRPGLLAVLLTLSSPVVISLASGQKGTLVLLLLTATWVLFRYHRPGPSGLIFSIIAFKPHLGIVVGLFMAVARQWRWLVGCLVGLVVFAALSLATGMDNCTGFIQTAAGFSDYVETGGYRLSDSYSLWSFYALLLGESTAARVLALMTGVGLVAFAVMRFRAPHVPNAPSEADSHANESENDRPGNDRCCADEVRWQAGFSLATILTCVVAPHFYYYDLAILICPIVLLADLAVRGYGRNVHTSVVVALVGTLFLTGYLTRLAEATQLHLGVLVLCGCAIAVAAVGMASPRRMAAGSK